MSKKAISLSQVTFKYKNSDNFAIQNISLDIEESDFLLLVGYSGSGKSTLLKTINGLIPNFHAGIFGGNISIFGTDIADTSTAKLAKEVGFVFQNPENQLSALTVEKEIAFPLENFGIPRDEIMQRIDEIVEMLDIGKIRYKSPFEISGGEQQLTAIAAALALDPKILILDEVTAHLSPKSARAILSKLAELNSEYKKTIIISEHRLDRCLQYATKIAFMEEGRLKLYDTPRAVLTSERYPIDMLPQIPKLFLKLQEEAMEFKDTSLPLTIDDLLLLLKGGAKS